MNWVITLTSFSKESLVRVREGKLRSLIRVRTAFINQSIVLSFLSYTGYWLGDLCDVYGGLLVVLVGIVIQRPKIELCSRSFHNKQSRRKWQPDRATTLSSFGIERSNQHLVYPSFCEIFPDFIQLWNATFSVVIHDKERIGIRVFWSQRWKILYTQTLAEGCQVSGIWLLTIFLSR